MEKGKLGRVGLVAGLTAVMSLSLTGCFEQKKPEPQKAPAAADPHAGHEHHKHHASGKMAGVEYMSADFAKAYHDKKEALFLDVRGDHAWAVEHIEGSISLPLDKIKHGARPEAAKDQMIIAYCGCPHSMSSEAAKFLKRSGFTNVFVLDEGYYFWKEAEYPVTVAQAEAADEMQRMTIRGVVLGLEPGTLVYARHPETDQLESGPLTANGSFELHLPFYNVADGAQISVTAAGHESTVPYQSGGAAVAIFGQKK